MRMQYCPCHFSLVSTGVFGRDKMTMCCLKMESSRMSTPPEETDRKLGGKAGGSVKPLTLSFRKGYILFESRSRDELVSLSEVWGFIFLFFF